MSQALRVAWLVALLALPASLAAQTPVAGAPVVGGSLSGVVHDVGGIPIGDVDVALIGESAGTRSDSAGHFTLRDVAPGNHTTLFRRIGFTSVEYRWTSRSGRALQITVTMAPAPRALDRVVVEAPGVSRRRGTSSIGGKIVDSANVAIAGADVRLLGAGLSTIADDTGGFQFQLLAAGSYILRARHRGVSPADYVMQIADDDPHAITLKLFGLPKKTSSRDSASASGYGIPDVAFDAFDRRDRASPGQPLLGPADLFRANRAPLGYLLQQYRDQPSTRTRRPVSAGEGAGSSDDGDCLVIDGRRPVYQPLNSYTSGDVLLVEVFRASAFVDESVVSLMDGIKECQGSMDHHPTYFVLWTRTLH